MILENRWDESKRNEQRDGTRDGDGFNGTTATHKIHENAAIHDFQRYAREDSEICRSTGTVL
jgi:hypothetical protein